jgi:hypothetical protein
MFVLCRSHWLCLTLIALAPLAAIAADDKKPISLFDGKTLAGWTATDFGGEGKVRIDDGRILMERGEPATGITITDDAFKKLPKIDYEITLEAMRVDGGDFFCGLTFPVNDDPCSLIVGGWGGGVVGLSSLNGSDASENETTTFRTFDNNKWYRIRLRVAKDAIDGWIDDEKQFHVNLDEVSVSIRFEVEPSRPLGFSCWNTTAALKNIVVKPLD